VWESRQAPEVNSGLDSFDPDSLLVE